MDKQSIFRVVKILCNTIRMDTHHYTLDQIYRRCNIENSVSLGEKKKTFKFLQHQGLPVPLATREQQQLEHYRLTVSNQQVSAGRLKKSHPNVWSLFSQWLFPHLQSHSFLLNYQCLFHFYLHSKVYLALTKIIQNTKISVVQKKTHQQYHIFHLLQIFSITAKSVNMNINCFHDASYLQEDQEGLR